MRRILLMLPFALAAFALAPVAAASAANTVTGACTVSGSASFTPNGLQATPQTLGYNFNGTGTCSGTLNGTPITNAPVSASASGSGTLSCAGAVTTGGTGSITFTGQGVSVGFGIDLVGTAFRPLRIYLLRHQLYPGRSLLECRYRPFAIIRN